jgi:hypothetical protein
MIFLVSNVFVKSRRQAGTVMHVAATPIWHGHQFVGKLPSLLSYYDPPSADHPGCEQKKGGKAKLQKNLGEAVAADNNG